MIFLIVVYLAVALLMLHSFYKRRTVFTWNFFFFLFFLLMARGSYAGFDLSWLGVPVVLRPITVAVLSNGIVFIVFYISLTYAESMINRLTLSLNNIFLIVILSSFFILILVFFFSLQLSGHPIGNFFINYPFKNQEDWFYCSVHFLSAFLIINCSKFKTYDWKVMFFLVPLINIWLSRYFLNKLSQTIEENIFFICLIAFGIFIPLKYETETTDCRKQTKCSHVVENIPFLFILVITAGFVFINFIFLNLVKLSFSMGLFILGLYFLKAANKYLPSKA